MLQFAYSYFYNFIPRDIPHRYQGFLKSFNSFLSFFSSFFISLSSFLSFSHSSFLFLRYLSTELSLSPSLTHTHTFFKEQIVFPVFYTMICFYFVFFLHPLPRTTYISSWSFDITPSQCLFYFFTFSSIEPHF